MISCGLSSRVSLGLSFESRWYRTKKISKSARQLLHALTGPSDSLRLLRPRYSATVRNDIVLRLLNGVSLCPDAICRVGRHCKCSRHFYLVEASSQSNCLLERWFGENPRLILFIITKRYQCTTTLLRNSWARPEFIRLEADRWLRTGGSVFCTP
jgi:hypothetical protein